MKKSLITVALASLFLIAACGEKAEALTVSNDYTVVTPNATFTFDEDGDEFSVGSNNLTISHSDTVDAGIDYTAGFGLFNGTVSYDYTSDEDSVIGLETSLAAYGASVAPSATWNIQDSQIDASVDVGYTMFGLDSTYTLDWNVSDMELTGTEASMGYTMNFGSLAVTPNVSIPFDSDWDRGITAIGLSVSVSFGSNGS
jgi:major membrane immunogen (membrane-anchored lipoprotein)